MLNVVSPPQITVRVGSEVPLVHRSPDADTKRIMKAIMDLLPAESRVARIPTEDEIALAMPPGHAAKAAAKAAAAAEAARRPGSD